MEILYVHFCYVKVLLGAKQPNNFVRTFKRPIITKEIMYVHFSHIILYVHFFYLYLYYDKNNLTYIIIYT